MSAIVEDDKVILITYVLRNSDGELLDSSEDSPLPYLHGHSNLVPGLERQLAGLSKGDTIQVEVSPEEGYGQPSGQDPEEVPREAFPADMELEPGMAFFAEAPNGEMAQIFIVGEEDGAVQISFDHPMAGETLFFDVEIIDIRDARQEEIDHGHPHGVHGDEGHHH